MQRWTRATSAVAHNAITAAATASLRWTNVTAATTRTLRHSAAPVTARCFSASASPSPPTPITTAAPSSLPPPPAPSSGCAKSRPSPAAPSRPLIPVDQLLETIRRDAAAAAAQAALSPAATVSPATAHSSSSGAANRILLDRFGRLHTYLRISLTERCNLRCVYCMPEEGVDLTASEALLGAEEIQRLLELFVRAGVTKLRLTGGEPTIRKDLAQIISQAAALRPQGLDAICLTSNGLVLARKLPSLIAAGLTHVNISLDTLDEHKFQIMTRRPGHHLVRKAIDEASRAVDDHTEAVARARELGEPLPTRGLRSVKINSVIMKGLNEAEIFDFVELTRHMNVEVRFIEYMPFDGNRWSDQKFLSYNDMLGMIRTRFPDIARADIESNETAKTWKVPGFRGRVGFISSMSDHFCATCNRLRLTADGNLKVCLFGPQEVSLRDAIRLGKSDEELGLIIGAAVQKKKAQHAGMTQLAQQKNRPMITIGG